MRGITNYWKRPAFWAVTAFAVVAYGNACAPNFSMMDDQDYSLLAASCKNDESLINDFALNPDKKVGYLGSQKVDYVPREDDLIQVNGDMLIHIKGGSLPSSPVPEGLSQGVGVTSGNRWPSGIVPYVIASDMPAVLQTRIASAIAHWNTNLAGVITLTPRTTQTDYASFTYVSSGCASVVGYTAGSGAHPSYLSTACDAGNIAHEIGHLVGLDHEQNRLDRDSYVTINFAKVSSGYSDNFAITTAYQNYNYYDFGSIMHYSIYAFSTDGTATIVPKTTVPSGITIGQRAGLSAGDINSVRLMYGYGTTTSTGGTTEVLTSANGIIGRYYNSYDFTSLVSERTDAQLNFDWGTTAPVTGQDIDTFSIRWSGYIAPPTTGTYYLVLQAMDEVRLVLNGQTLFQMMNGNSIQEAVSVPISLTTGTKYSIMTEYRASTAKASSYIRLYWRKPDGSQELIPASAYSPDSASQVVSPCSATWNADGT